MQTMRELMMLMEATIPQIKRQKRAWLRSLVNVMDKRSVAAVMETNEADSEKLASAWFDRCMTIYQHIQQQGKCPIYRQMMVEDFAAFIQSLKNGIGRLGEYWSIHYGIESPTWNQDQRGDVPISMEGEIDAGQIDWEATLRQNFEWPREFELIFSGDVLVRTIEDQDTGTEVHLNQRYRR